MAAAMVALLALLAEPVQAANCVSPDLNELRRISGYKCMRRRSCAHVHMNSVCSWLSLLCISTFKDPCLREWAWLAPAAATVAGATAGATEAAEMTGARAAMTGAAVAGETLAGM